MNIDPVALSYNSVAGRYEAGRPDYQPHLVNRVLELFDPSAGQVVVDLAAGTGKFTRALASSGANVVAIEPVEAMATTLRGVVEGVAVVRGLAGALPLVDASVSCISVAQAFQWFDPSDLVEIARVLVPGGVLALVWNRRQDSGDWARVAGILDEFRPRSPRRVDAVAVLDRSGAFSPAEVERWPWVRELNRTQLHDHIASLSWIAALESPERDRLHCRIDEEFGNASTHELDYVSELISVRLR